MRRQQTTSPMKKPPGYEPGGQGVLWLAAGEMGPPSYQRGGGRWFQELRSRDRAPSRIVGRRFACNAS
jgi:hypothetical protein